MENDSDVYMTLANAAGNIWIGVHGDIHNQRRKET